MVQVYKFEDENEEKCRLKCLDELDVYNNEILTKEYEEENKYVMEVVKKEDIKNFIREYLEKVTTEMGLDAKIEINEDEDVFSVKMFSNNNPILIGKNGQTLSSLQTIVKQMVMIKYNTKLNIVLDVENYKSKQMKNLEFLARKLAKEVSRTKIETKMDSMNSYQRRIVHNAISKFKDVYTESVGEEPNRYIVIKPKQD